MKKISLLLTSFLLLFLVNQTKAQEVQDFSQNEIRVIVGDGLPFTVSSGFFDAFAYTLERLNSNYRRKFDGGKSSTPHLGIGYKYYVSERFNIGLDLSFQSSKDNFRFEPRKDDLEEFHSKGKKSLFLIMPTIEYIYMNRPKTKLYGNIKGGIAFIHKEEKFDSNQEDTDYSDQVGALQINPIGFRYGKDIGGFIEVGVGFQSIFAIGFSAKF